MVIDSYFKTASSRSFNHRPPPHNCVRSRFWLAGELSPYLLCLGFLLCTVGEEEPRPPQDPTALYNPRACHSVSDDPVLVDL